MNCRACELYFNKAIRRKTKIPKTYRGPGQEWKTQKLARGKRKQADGLRQFLGRTTVPLLSVCICYNMRHGWDELNLKGQGWARHYCTASCCFYGRRLLI